MPNSPTCSRSHQHVNLCIFIIGVIKTNPSHSDCAHKMDLMVYLNNKMKLVNKLPWRVSATEPLAVEGRSAIFFSNSAVWASERPGPWVWWNVDGTQEWSPQSFREVLTNDRIGHSRLEDMLGSFWYMCMYDFSDAWKLHPKLQFPGF